MQKKRAIFLDRDGTINEEVGYIEHLNRLRIIPEAYEAIRLINISSFRRRRHLPGGVAKDSLTRLL
jgi:histidinol phosphatase-like enzyme